MSARDLEAALIDKCARAARDPLLVAADAREANVFRLAGMVLGGAMKQESQRLMHASESYFDLHPDTKIKPVDVVRLGWVADVPRFREMLNNKVKGLRR